MGSRKEGRDGKETKAALRFTKTWEAQGVAPDMLTDKVEVAFYKNREIYITITRRSVTSFLHH
jgi:hypothetical protein